MALRVVGAGLGRTGTAFAEARARAAARRPLLPHGRDLRPSRRHPRVARRGQRQDRRTGTRSSPTTSPPSTGRRAAFWRELGRRQSPTPSCCCRPGRAPTRGGRARTTPSSRSRGARSRATHRRCSAAQIAMASDMFAIDVHPRLGRRDDGQARLRGAQRRRAGQRRSRRASSTGSPATAGSRICTALDVPVPDRPVPARQLAPPTSAP